MLVRTTLLASRQSDVNVVNFITSMLHATAQTGQVQAQIAALWANLLRDRVVYNETVQRAYNVLGSVLT